MNPHARKLFAVTAIAAVLPLGPMAMAQSQAGLNRSSAQVMHAERCRPL